MQCGAKCFYVEIDQDGVKETKKVFSRTPITARKTIRKTYGEAVEIISVRKNNV